jgi:hypothetical protein
MAACVVALNNDASVTATFEVLHLPLTVASAGTGTGSVTSAPAGIDCGSSCTANFPTGTTITLTSTAQAGSTFEGWSGVCNGSQPTCEITLDQAGSVTATFAKEKESVSIYLPLIVR